MPRILIADDNSNIQKMVTLALQGAGIEVVSVSNGGAAIRSLPETSPDLVLADVFMPVRSGYEVCDFIKHEPRFAHVPVVLLVGAFDPLDESEAQRVSADGILKKPFIPPDPLINLVKALLAKSFQERPEPAPVHVGAPAAAERARSESAPKSSESSTVFGDAPEDEFVPEVLGPDFGGHEETLAFGSLLHMPAPAEAPAEPLSPAPSAPDWGKAAAEEEAASVPSLEESFWGKAGKTSVETPDGDILEDDGALEDGCAEELRAPGSHDFAGAQIPELDEIAPPEQLLHENLPLEAAPASDDGELAAELGSPAETSLGSEPGAEIFPELASEREPEIEAELDGEFAEGFRSALASEPAQALPESPANDAEMWAPWEAEKPEPMSLEPTVNGKAAGEAFDEFGDPETMAEDEALGESDWANGETADDDLQAAVEPAIEGAAEEAAGWPGEAGSWPGPAAPVFPGSEKLWAWPPPAHSENKDAAAEVKKEVGQASEEAGAAPAPASAAPEAFGIREIDLSKAHWAEARWAGVAEPVAEEAPSMPLVAEPAADAAAPQEKPEPIAAEGAQSAWEARAEQASAAKSAGMADPELIEAMVTRIVERMQPKVMDVVTREILRPLVEALVRREINKAS